MDPTVEPTVQVTPTFTVGQTIRHASEGTEHVILAITPEGHLQIAGRAGLLPATAAEPL